MKTPIFTICLVAAVTLALQAQATPPPQPAAGAARPQDPWTTATFNALRLRAVGPALMSGHRGAESGSPTTIQNRVNSAVQGSRGLSGSPTGTQQMNYTIANDELTAQVALLRTLEAELRKFETQLEAAGVPYTPGRGPGQGV